MTGVMKQSITNQHLRPKVGSKSYSHKPINVRWTAAFQFVDMDISPMASVLKEGAGKSVTAWEIKWEREDGGACPCSTTSSRASVCCVEKRMMKYESRPVLPAGLPSPFGVPPLSDTKRFCLKSDPWRRAASAGAAPPDPGEFLLPLRVSQQTSKPRKSVLCRHLANNPRHFDMAFRVNVALAEPGLDVLFIFMTP